MTDADQAQRGVSQPLYAHSKSKNVPGGERHLLVDHLRNVAELARQRASLFGGGDIAYLAGLWHDAGKADPNWQRYLLQSESGVGGAGRIDHKCAGVLLAEEAGQLSLVGPLIHAHHGGLADPQKGFRPWLEEKRALPGPKRALEALRLEMPEITEQTELDIPRHLQGGTSLATEFFLRMTYSALVDADSLDTKAHHDGEQSIRSNAITLEQLWDRYQSFIAGEPPPPDTTLSGIRNEVYEACLRAASEPSGRFSLTVPTGGGKTRSAMAFALRHGIEHDMRRVIVAVPFTTITQQTADVYRRIFERGYADAGRVVLEHHSAAAEGSDDESPAVDAVWQRLSAENWDAPIVVTTTVQLFESLFSNRRGKTRKLHNLARSVIVLDEAQALPPRLLAPILDSLRELTEHYGATVVLSTATQPAFSGLDGFRDFESREIIADPGRHFEVLKRVEYDFSKAGEANAWGDVAAWMREERSALAIVNTKGHAQALLDALDDPDALHLSTLLCPAHRSEALDEIKARLADGRACRVVSTQVVEAGVDLDFAAVFRAEAPLDAIIQAAGRCNREGRLDAGRVVVFKPPDGAAPFGVYRSGIDIACVVRALPGFDPNNPKTVKEYFALLFGSAVDPDQHGIQQLRKGFDYPEVAKRFRMIEDDTCDVIVDYPNRDVGRIDHLVDELRTRARPAREILRELRPHMVSLYRHEYERRAGMGLIDEVIPGVGRWPQGYYDPVRGITDADPDMIF